MRILIDPRCMFNYASFYMQGLHEIYGKKCKFPNNACFEILSLYDYGTLLAQKKL